MVEAVASAMHDDLNPAAALGELSEPLSAANRLLASGKGVSKVVRWRTLDAFMRGMSDVSCMLGLFGADPRSWLMDRRDLKARRDGLDVARVEALLEARTQARASKDFARSDAIRDELAALGVCIRDTPGGAEWSL